MPPFKMKFLPAIFLAISSCSHIRIVAFDKESNTVSVQASKRASEEDVQKAAEKYCGGPAKLMAMGENTVGTYTSASGGNGFASATTIPINRSVFTYSCAGH